MSMYESAKSFCTTIFEPNVVVGVKPKITKLFCEFLLFTKMQNTISELIGVIFGVEANANACVVVCCITGQVVFDPNPRMLLIPPADGKLSLEVYDIADNPLPLPDDAPCPTDVVPYEYAPRDVGTGNKSISI